MRRHTHCLLIDGIARMPACSRRRARRELPHLQALMPDAEIELQRREHGRWHTLEHHRPLQPAEEPR